MTIQRIAESNGFKLVAYNQAVQQKHSKPVYTSTSFADFKDGVLRGFSGTSSFTIAIGSWKECLQYLRKLTCPIYDRA
jgi:hypothetical protein